MLPFRELEHTADIGLEIYGNTIRGLFLNGIKGLFYLILPDLKVTDSDISNLNENQVNKIDISADNYEELLVCWLNEFIYNFFEKRLLPEGIEILELSKSSVKANVKFKELNKFDKTLQEIKAATYHDISIKRINGKYQARVIFDV